ncbi:MAG: glycosyltransferase [Oscillospiraceae bacterium]
MPNKIKVSGCIVTYNDFDKAINAVDSVLCQTKRVDFKLYISDNASKNSLCEKLQSKHPGISIIKNKTNVGFGKAHNKVIDLIDSDYHAIINPDIIVNSDVISDVCEYMEKNNIAVMATPKILSGDGTEQFLPRKRPKFKYMLAGRLPFLSKLRDEYTMKSSPVTEPAEI